MISFLKDTIVGFVNFILGLLPEFVVPIITMNDEVLEIINAIHYFLPMNTISDLFRIVLLLTSLRIILAVILRAKSFIPTLGA